MFIGLLGLCFGGSLASDSRIAKVSNTIKCISLNNWQYQARPTLVNSNGTPYYPFNVSVNICSGSCNTTDDSYVQTYVPDKVKNTNLKVFDLTSKVNETRFLVQHY